MLYLPQPDYSRYVFYRKHHIDVRHVHPGKHTDFTELHRQMEQAMKEAIEMLMRFNNDNG